jgi:hypothetical protein
MRPPHTCCDPTLTDGEPGLSICQTSLSAIGGSGYGALRQQGSARERRGARPGRRGGPPAGSAGCEGGDRRRAGQSGPVVGCRAWAGCVLRPARCDLGSRLGPRCRSRPEARRLARLGQQRRNLPAGRADGDRRRALAATHPDQSVRLLPRHEGGSAGDGALGRRVHREYLVSRRPQGLARVLRLCRDQSEHAKSWGCHAAADRA